MANYTNSEQMTPLDLLMPKVYITALLTFPTHESTPIVTQSLRNGLKKLSQQLPWVSGRVFTTKSSGNRPSLEMCWNADTTPELIDRGCIEQPYAELAASKMPPEAFPPKMLPISVMTEHNPAEKGAPVFAASFFRFGDSKGLGLYISMHHNVVDATGFSKVVELFALNVAAVESPSLGMLDRVHRLSHALSSDLDTVSSKSTETLFESHPEYARSPPVFPSEFPLCTSRLFPIPVSRIDALKQRLTVTMSTPPTTNTILSALTWSAITRARIQRDQGLTKKSSRLAMAINGRRRIEEFTNSDDPYFGNMVVYSMAVSQADALGSMNDQGSIGALAKICQAIAESQSTTRINSRHVAEVYHLANSVDDYKSIFVGWDLFGSTDLTITSWADLGFYDMNFGSKLGKPEFLRVPYMEADGVGLILPRKREDNEVIEVMVMLRRDDMDVLGESWGL